MQCTKKDNNFVNSEEKECNSYVFWESRRSFVLCFGAFIIKLLKNHIELHEGG